MFLAEQLGQLIICSTKYALEIFKMIITSIILLLLLPTQTHSCPNSKSFRHSTCTFHLNYSPQCLQFIFLSCEWKECPDGASGLCNKYAHKNHTSWSICTEICCGNSAAYAPNPKGLDQCQDYIDQQHMKDIVITIVIPIGCITLAVICCCCCKWRHNRSQSFRDRCKQARYYFYSCVTCRCCREGMNQRQSNVKWDSSLSLELQQSIIEPIWGTRLVLKHSEDIFCSVCLEENTSLSLQCGHNYHRQCILQCLRRKRECILCRCTEISKITVYCQKCYTSSYQTRLWQSIEFLDKKKQICDLCAYMQERQVDLGLFSQ